MATIDLASNSALLSVAEKLAEQNQLLSSIAVRGKSAFIRYSAYNDGTDFTETWSAGQNYIGHAVDFEAPTDKSAYTWSLFASNIRETLTITLPADAWSNNAQTFETLMIGENSTVFPTPAPECKDDYLSAGVMISAATATSLVFTCVNTPATDITVTVYITEPAAVVGGADSGLGQSDWAAGEGEPGEILNKPFGDILLYSFNNRDEFLNGQDVATQLVAGETYTVVFDGVSYTCTAKTYDDCVRLGNNDIYEGVETTKTEPFAIEQSGTTVSGYLAADDTAEHTVQIIFTKTIDPKYSGASWDALVGKPFYEGTVDLGETITWDGTIDENTVYQDLEGLDVPSEATFKLALQYVSSSVPTIEELQNCSISAWMELQGESRTNTTTGDQLELIEQDGVIFDTDQMLFFVATKENTTLVMPNENFPVELVMPKPGVYIMYELIEQGTTRIFGYVTDFTIPGYNFQMHGVQKLDPKFVHTPDWNAQAGEPGEILNRPFGEVAEKLGDTITWNGTYDANTIKQFDSIVNDGMRGIIHTQYVSSSVPTIEELQTGSIAIVDDYNGDVITETVTLDTVSFDEYNGTIIAYPSNGPSIPFVVATKENVVCLEFEAPVTLPKKGIYLIEIRTEATEENTRLSISEFTIPGYNFKMNGIKKLDPKYVYTPDWNAGTGTGGEILNRPFYDYTQEFGDTITWDGTEAHEYDVKFELGGAMCLHAHYVAGNIPTEEELLTGSVDVTTIDGSNDRSYKGAITSDKIRVDAETGIIQIANTAFMIVPNANTTMEFITFEHPGVYAMNISEQDYLVKGNSLTIPGYSFYTDNFKKIDPKFTDTPDWDAIENQAGYIKNRPFGRVIGTSDTLHKDIGYGELVSMLGIMNFYHMYDNVPTAEELVGGTVTITDPAGANQMQLEITTDMVQDAFGDGNAWSVNYSLGENSGNAPIVLVIPNDGYTFTQQQIGITLTFNKKGVYFFSSDLVGLVTESLHIPGYEFPSISVKTIDPEYLPESLRFGEFGLAPMNWSDIAPDAPYFSYPEAFSLVKVSDRILTANDLAGSVFTLSDSTGENVWTVEGPFEINPWNSDTGAIEVFGKTFEEDTYVNPLVFSITQSDNSYGVPTGTYLACMVAFGDYHVETITFPTTVTKVDAKYLPEGIGYEEVIKYDTLEWDGAVDEVNDVVCADGQIIFHKVSEVTPAVYELIGGTCTAFVDGQDIVTEISSNDWDRFDDYDYYYVGPVVIVRKENTTIEYGLFTEPGIYFGYQNDALFVKSIKAAPGAVLKSETILHQIDPKYIFGNQGVTVEWDGVLEGKETIEFTDEGKEYTLVKLTDRAFTEEELASAIVTYADQTTGSLTELESMLETVYNTVLDSNGNYGFHRLQLLSSPSKLTNAGHYGFFELEATGTYVTYNADLSLPEIIKLEVPNAYQTIDEKYLPNNYVTRAMFDDEVAQRRALENVIGYNGTWTGLTLVDALSETFATKEDISVVEGTLNAFESHLGFVTTGFEEQTVAEKIYDTFATKDELIAATEPKVTAAVGQTIVVKAVDENGRPTEWEAVNMPTFELVSPNGTRYNLAVADDGTLSAVAVVEEPADPVEPEPEEPTDPEEPVDPEIDPTDPEVDPTEPTGDATEE